MKLLNILNLRVYLIVITLALTACGGGGSETNDTGGLVDPPLNSAPVVAAFSVDSANVRAGESVLYQWAIVDEDLETLDCELDFDGSGSQEVDCDATTDVSHIFNDVGTFTSVLTVTDSDGLATNSSVLIAVSAVDSDIPSIASFSLLEPVVIVGQEVEIVWSVDVTDDDNLSCEIDADGDAVAEYAFDPCPISGSQLHTFDQAGAASLSLTVRSGVGATVTESIVVNVLPADESNVDNRPPFIADLTALPTPVMIDQAVTFSWQISDPDQDVLFCELDFDGNGSADMQITDCASGQSVVHRYLASGDFEPVLTVRDQDGAEVQLGASVTVFPVQVSFAVFDTVGAGGALRYEFTVSNISPIPVSNVNLLFRVPVGLFFGRSVDVLPDTFSCGTSCVEGEEAMWNFPSIAAGGSRTIVVNANVLESNANGSVIDGRLDVTADGFVETISVTGSVVIENSPVATLGLSASKDTVVAGESVTATLDIGNTSSANLEELEIRTQVPRASLIEDISDGGVIDAETGEVVWSLAQLSVLQTRRLTVDFALPESVVSGQILTIDSTLTVGNNPSVIAGKTDTFVVSEAPSPLQVDVAILSDPVNAGGRLNYQLTVGNTGLVPLNSVGVVLRVPAGVQFSRSTDASPDVASCGTTCVAGEEAVWTFDSIPAGATETIVVNALVNNDVQGGGLIEAILFVESSNTVNDISRLHVVGVDNVLDSQLGLSVSADPIIPGQTFMVTVDAGNISATNLENAVVSLELPENMSVVSISDSGSQGANGLITWPSQQIPVLSGLRFNVQLAASTNAVAGQILKLRSLLVHDGGVLDDVAAEQVVTVSGQASPVSLELVPDFSEISSGGRLRYEFRVTNSSLVPVTDVEVLYRLPNGVSFSRSTDVEPDTFSCGTTCIAGEEAIWVFDTILSGETVSVSVNTNVSEQLQAGNLLNNSVTVRGPGIADAVHLQSIVRVN